MVSRKRLDVEGIPVADSWRQCTTNNEVRAEDPIEKNPETYGKTSHHTDKVKHPSSYTIHWSGQYGKNQQVKKYTYET